MSLSRQIDSGMLTLQTSHCNARDTCAYTRLKNAALTSTGRALAAIFESRHFVGYAAQRRLIRCCHMGTRVVEFEIGSSIMASGSGLLSWKK